MHAEKFVPATVEAQEGHRQSEQRATAKCGSNLIRDRRGPTGYSALISKIEQGGRVSNRSKTRGLLSLPGMLDEAEQEAIDFLREHEPPEGYQLSFSGGKDSIVMRHLADMAEVKYTALFNCTTIDPPEIYAFIRRNYPDTVWHYPRHNFFRELERRGPAWRKVRWCCQIFKETKNLKDKHRILIGIRAEESWKRARRPRVEPSKKKKSLTYYAPIHQWKEWQIWEYIEKYSLPYPSLYDEGYSRVGCKLCPMTFAPGPAAQARLEREKKKFPHFTMLFERALRKWWNRTSAPTAKIYATFEEWLAWYYKGFPR